MKRSELQEFIKEEILTTIKEATIETSPQNLSKVKSQAKDDDIIKVVEDGIEEANIGLADLEEVGYTDGDKAVDMHFFHDVTGINSTPDYLAYKKGFVQAVVDRTNSFGKHKHLKEDATPKGEDFFYDYLDIGMSYLEGFGKKHSLDDTQLEKLGKKIVDQLYKGDVGKAYDAIVKRDLMKEDEDDDVDAKAIKAAKGARGKHKKLDIAVKALRDITTEMKSLARDYSKADGVEKEKIKDKLKSKTSKKKELEALVSQLEKNVI